MKSIEQLNLNSRIMFEDITVNGGAAWVAHPLEKHLILVVFSFGGGWDHVSASYKHRCPTWDEMCFVKDLFFHDNECVVQYHPPKADYKNIHPFCLHLWRPQEDVIVRPPQYMV